jgi:hypothetical protein
MPSLIAPLWIEQGVAECPNPDNDIRRFDANMRLFPPIIDNEKCPLTINHTLLQSCYLRYTEWACGVAIYTGKDNTCWYHALSCLFLINYTEEYMFEAFVVPLADQTNFM